MKLLGKFETTQKSVAIIDTEQTPYGWEPVLAIETISRKDNKVLIRYGNKTQTLDILKTYKYSIKGEKDTYHWLIKLLA